MLFKWFRIGLFFDKDGGAGGAKPDDSAEEESGEKKPGESKAGDDDPTKAKKEDKQFSQAQVDQIVKERLDREHKKTEEAAAKAKKEAEEAALKDKEEWKTLAEKRQTEIDDLKKQAAELESAKAQADKYKAALDARLAEIKKTLPKFVLPLLEKMDPVEAMQYITDNADDLGAKPETYSQTPKGQQKKVTDDDAKEAKQTSASIVTRSF
jgi:hypothetical protein